MSALKCTLNCVPIQTYATQQQHVSCSDLQHQVAFSKSIYLSIQGHPLRLDHSHSPASPTFTPRSSTPHQQIGLTSPPAPTVQRKRRPLPLCDGGWLVIREGQIASLGLPAICRPARLIPPHGTGLPGSGLLASSRLSPRCLTHQAAKKKKKPSLCPTASHQC